jgi:hypothetical protein
VSTAPTLSEHVIEYQYKGESRTMVVKKVVTHYERLYFIRTKKGIVALQYFDYRWNPISDIRISYDLARIIGEAIETAKLL